MAEATDFRNNAMPFPVRLFPWTVVFPILDADGDLVTGAAGLDSEISKNGDTFTDCTNEATEIATSSGMYYLTLTASEMTCDVAAIIVKTSTSGAKTTPIVLYPKKAPASILGTGTGTSQGASATNEIQLSSDASAIDDFFNGMIVYATIDGVAQIRVINDYTGSSKLANVSPAFTVQPDNDDTYNIYFGEGVFMPPTNVIGWNTTTVATPATAGIPDVNAKNWNNLATVALPLVPTTAGRTLDVSTTGEAGLDWANIGSPTTTNNLSGTTIKAVTDAVSANVASINSISTSSVTTVSANQGTTQPVNFTGTAGSALVKSDTVDIAGAAVSTSTAQVGVNVVSYASGQAPLQPTVAARTLDVSATGEAGVDWANIGSPTTTVGLTGTTISSAQVVASVTGAVGSVSGAVGSVTGNVGGNVTGSVGSVVGNVGGNVTGSVGSVVGAVGSVTGAVGSVTGNVGGNVVGTVASVVGNVAGNVTGSIGSLATQAKADVNGEMVDVLSVDTYAEPTGVPAATVSLAAKIGRLYQALRNSLTVTATAKTFKDDAAADLWKKPLSDDGTTYTEGEGTTP